MTSALILGKDQTLILGNPDLLTGGRSRLEYAGITTLVICYVDLWQEFSNGPPY